jgi:Cu/Ag efflux protein CusF
MKTKLIAPLVAIALAAACAPALAQTGHSHDHGTAKAGAARPATDVTTGEIRRINKDAKTLTLRHGPLEAFNMGAMTMTFPVRDAAQLAKLKEGDNVRFTLEKTGDDLVITRIEPAR